MCGERGHSRTDLPHCHNPFKGEAGYCICVYGGGGGGGKRCVLSLLSMCDCVYLFELLCKPVCRGVGLDVLVCMCMHCM